MVMGKTFAMAVPRPNRRGAGFYQRSSTAINGGPGSGAAVPIGVSMGVTSWLPEG